MSIHDQLEGMAFFDYVLGTLVSITHQGKVKLGWIRRRRALYRQQREWRHRECDTLHQSPDFTGAHVSLRMLSWLKEACSLNSFDYSI